MFTISFFTKRISFIYLAVLLCVIFSTTLAQAATLGLKTELKQAIGERIVVDVVIDPQGESINSIESSILFSSEYLTFNGFSAKQSSIPIWVEEPKEKVPGAIHFSGVIPGGLDRLYDPMNTNNKTIPVVRLFFISKKAGTTTLRVGDSSVLKNDGKGTAVSVGTTGATLTLLAVAGREVAAPLLQDITPPNPFTVSIIERSLFGKTPRLAVFSAEDSEGGIERYEMAVGNLSPHTVTSPAALPYRLFAYILTVKAYDFSGNVREEQVTVSGEKSYGLGLGLIVLLALILVIRYRIYKKRTI